MELTLTPELEQLVRTQIASGKHGSANDVVVHALKLLEKREELKNQIEEGWLSADRGHVVEGDIVFDRIDSELDSLEKAAVE